MNPGHELTPRQEALAFAQRLRQGPGHIHLMGLGGVGMAGLATLLAGLGHRVSGCDPCESVFLRCARERGVVQFCGQGEEHMSQDVDVLVRSTAVPLHHPEVAAARRRGVPVFRRGAALAGLLEGREVVAVAGTHGKTSTTAMLVHVLRALQDDPSFFIGGWLSSLGAMAQVGAGARWVVEADESDGTLAAYAPRVAVINNMDVDHMEHFASAAAFEACFDSLRRQTRGTVIYGLDDARARALCEGRPDACGVGLGEGAALRAVEVRCDATGSSFGVVSCDGASATVRLEAAGLHQVRNALAALAACRALGVDLSEACAALGGFRSVQRRFQWVARVRGGGVVSDYAHHPTELRALLDTALLQGARRILILFQPHRYTRTLALGHAFPAAFRGADLVVLTPVYAASEAPLPGGTSRDLLAHVEQAGWTPVELADSLRDGWDRLAREMREGDLILLAGAGDIEGVARWASAELQEEGEGDDDVQS